MQFHFKNFKKRFSAFKFSPKLWDKPTRTALGPFLRLWSTQTFSTLGSSMASFALVIWAYEQSGPALSTALLSICSYAPYVLLSIFAGALSDRWNKKATMLICDAAAALTTVGVLVLLSTDALGVWHLYVLNALNGLMNTCAGLAMVIGSVIVSLLPAPKSRTRVICNALLVSMSTESFLLALGHSMPVWCVGAVLGWLPIPLMNANLDVLFRTHIPVKMQGRVYAARNSLPF